PRCQRTKGRVVQGRRRLIAGGHEKRGRAVRRNRVGQRANERDLVEHLRHLWQVLTDLDALHLRGYWLEFAPNALRSIRFEVPHIDRGRPAREPDHDDRIGLAFGDGFLLRLGFELEQLRQREPEEAGTGTDLEEVATMEALAVRPLVYGHMNSPL